MKATALFLAPALIFLFTSPSFSANTHDDLVSDYNGKPLERGVSYYIRPPVIGPGYVGMALIPNNETCEFDVIQGKIAWSGIRSPFTFTPVLHGKDVINIGAPVVIESTVANPCGESSIWKVSPCTTPCVPIVTGGGRFGASNSCFKIAKAKSTSQWYMNTYELQFSPNACACDHGEGEKIDYPIGLYEANSGDSYTHLTTQGVTYHVSFYKVLEEKLDIVI